MRRRLLLPALAFLTIALAVSGCDTGESSRRATVITPTVPSTTAPSAPAPATTTPRAASPAAGSATTQAATPSSRPSPSPAPGRIDGTVAPQNFGSTEAVTVKSDPNPLQGTALLRDVRLGVHPEEGGWDRIVFEFAGDLPPGAVAYVPSVAGCGSGLPVTLQGGAILAVRFTQTSAHSDAGQATVARMTIPGPGGTILEARQTCDFEGEVTWAIGVKDHQRFKVTLLAAPRRVVIDIKQ